MLVGFFVGSAGIKSFAQQALNSLSDRNNFLEPHVFGFSNSLPDILKDSTEL